MRWEWTVEAMQIAVIGGAEASSDVVRAAEAVGRGLALAGVTLVCGGLGGVMAAACRGAKSADGRTVGILPGSDLSEANQWVDVIIPTGLGEARNSLVVRAAAAVIAVDGEYGTLSEIALALRAGIPVIGLGTWSLIRPDGRPRPGNRVGDEPSGGGRRGDRTRLRQRRIDRRRSHEAGCRAMPSCRRHQNRLPTRRDRAYAAVKHTAEGGGP